MTWDKIQFLRAVKDAKGIMVKEGQKPKYGLLHRLYYKLFGYPKTILGMKIIECPIVPVGEIYLQAESPCPDCQIRTCRKAGKK